MIYVSYALYAHPSAPHPVPVCTTEAHLSPILSIFLVPPPGHQHFHVACHNRYAYGSSTFKLPAVRIRILYLIETLRLLLPSETLSVETLPASCHVCTSFVFSICLSFVVLFVVLFAELTDNHLTILPQQFLKQVKMSIVGNFAFNNYDRTLEASGAGAPTRPRRFSHVEEDAAREEPLSLHRTNTSRRRSVARKSSDAQPLQRTRTNDRKSSDETTIADHTKQQPQSGAVHGRAPYYDTVTSEVPANKLDAVGSTEDSDNTSEAERDDQVKELARQFTRTSTFSQVADNPLEAEPGSSVDPSSENFKARAWAKSMLKLQSQQEERFQGRSAGVAFRNLSAYGFGAATDYQKSVGNVFFEVVGFARKLMGSGQRRIDILRNFDGLVKPGEMLVVLGPPGSGCSTFLKTLAGETNGFVVDKDSYMNYRGISFKQMHKEFRGEAIYTAEQDVHFPMMTVGDTLSFAARARAPRIVPGGVKREVYADHLRDVMMATFGIRHTINTKVGNDFVRGVSGGERKRVSIAEAALSAAPLQCWDNSTRGLDSANAIEFCKTLRISTELGDAAAAVAIYQAPQSAYDIFDKAIVLYEGRQIFFGRTDYARRYFENMGFECPERQTTADFLTSMTSPVERVVRKGFENKVPRTPDEFATAWKNSPEHQQLLQEIDQFDKEHPIGGEDLARFQQSRRQQQAKHQSVKSPYTLSYIQQIRLCLWRGLKRLTADPSLTFTQLFGNVAMAFIIGSIFYNLGHDTNSFYSRGALLFFAVLLNAFGSALEILTLYAQRPIVEKHARYALYHPSAEAVASMLTDMPYKIANAIVFNTTLYFLTNLRRTPGAFFFFLLITFTLTLFMSMLFRTIASVSRTLSQALAPAAVLILAIVIYTGFTIPTRYMLGWSRWINYINPVAYGFESLMINEFSGQDYECSTFVPTGPSYGTGLANRICTSTGSVAGQAFVNGNAYINTSFAYYASHRWRNFGIIIAFTVFFMFCYLVSAELVSSKKSKGEVLVFRRGHTPATLTKTTPDDAEAAGAGHAVPTEKQSDSQNISNVIQKQTAIFQWHDVCYDIKIKTEERRILDHVDGWVKPGTLTALMVSLKHKLLGIFH